jgi:XPG N-terminal domain
MGVPGLLVGLKSFVVKGSVRSYASQSLAVDLSGWLHKSVYSIADHFVEEEEQQKQNQKQQKRHGVTSSSSTASSRSLSVSSSYIIQRCHELLRFAGVAKIYLVLDGRRWYVQCNVCWGRRGHRPFVSLS